MIQQVFSNIEVIFRFNLELLLQLEPRLQNKQGGNSGNIGDIFLMLGPFLKMYTAYGNNYEAAAEKHQKLMAENKAYASIVEVRCLPRVRAWRRSFNARSSNTSVVHLFVRSFIRSFVHSFILVRSRSLSAVSIRCTTGTE